MHSSNKKQPFFAIDGPLGGFSTQKKADDAIRGYSRLLSVITISNLAVYAMSYDSIGAALLFLFLTIISILSYFNIAYTTWILCIFSLFYSINLIYGALLIMEHRIYLILVPSVILYSSYRVLRGLLHKSDIVK